MERPVPNILYSSGFQRAIKKIPIELREEVGKREMMFRENCFDSRLRTHKLKGSKKDLWSFSVTHKYRILFRFIDARTAYFMHVGDHSIYQ